MIYDTLLWLEMADAFQHLSLVASSVPARRLEYWSSLKSAQAPLPTLEDTKAWLSLVLGSFKRCHHPLFSSPLGKIWRSRAKAFQWMPRVRSHLGTVASIQNSNVIRLRLNLRSLRFTGQPINPSKVGNFKLGWCQEFQMSGVHWLVHVGYIP